MSVHAVTVFLRGHAFSHSDEVSVSLPFSMADQLWAETTSADRRCMPEGLNSLAWQIWHMACSEDEGLALIAGLPRLFDEASWANRLGYARRHAHGMTQEDSRELAEKIDTDAVWAYRNAVGIRTRAVIESHELDHWLNPLEPFHLDQAVDLGVIAPEAAESMASFLLGLTKEDLMGWWGLNHSLLHLGQASALLKILAKRKDRA